MILLYYRAEGALSRKNVGNTGVRHERNGRETPRPSPCDFTSVRPEKGRRASQGEETVL